jgi:hypothetical protein
MRSFGCLGSRRAAIASSPPPEAGEAENCGAARFSSKDLSCCLRWLGGSRADKQSWTCCANVRFHSRLAAVIVVDDTFDTVAIPVRSSQATIFIATDRGVLASGALGPLAGVGSTAEDC